MNRPILDGLIEYKEKEYYPWHMPGHKRRFHTIFPELIKDPFSIDITEVNGMDEFHCPEGMIKESIEQLKHIYGSDDSYYLVNGSTCGILAAISSVCKVGDEIIVARNCHTSVYKAIGLLNLKPIYVMPTWHENLRMFGEISADQIREALKNHPRAGAVLIVSPTYEGVVSDIQGIARVTDEFNVPFIVDEAHGAHFEFLHFRNEEGLSLEKDFPIPAILQGANIVIESLHKTLPAMTQCAILHTKNLKFDKQRLEECLSIYQSSSPSYVFMATMEACVTRMHEERGHLFKIYKNNIKEFRSKCQSLKHIHLVDYKDFGLVKEEAYDNGKLVFTFDCCGVKDNGSTKPFTGVLFGKILEEKYGQVLELMSANYVIAMTSIADSKEAFDSFFEIIREIDCELIDLDDSTDTNSIWGLNYNTVLEQKMLIGEAKNRNKTLVPLTDALGRISSEFIYAYPPGIPVITPGEVFSIEIIEEIKNAKKEQVNIKGVIGFDHSQEIKPELDRNKEMVYVIKE